MREIKTKHLFRIALRAGTPHVIGRVAKGERRPSPVIDGTFEGERLKGEVLNGSNDWILIRSDGVWELDVRLALRTHDGEMIAMTYRGLRHGPPDVLERVGRGEIVDPWSYYFRTAVMFETGSDRYAWLNRLIGIGFGFREPDGPRYDVFEVL